MPIDSVRERLAREVAIRVKMPADRGVFETLGEIFARHRGDRRVSFEIELPSEPTRCACKADVTSQIRVRPSPALDRRSGTVVGRSAVRGVEALKPDATRHEEPMTSGPSWPSCSWLAVGDEVCR